MDGNTGAGFSCSLTAALPMVRESGSVKLSTPCNIYAECGDMCRMAQESFVCFDMNAKNQIIEKRLISLGIVNASLVHPREVFRGAIVNGACSVIVAHNHPTGDTAPGAEDLLITRQLVEAGKIIGIRVLDHVIIGRPSDGQQGWLSMQEVEAAINKVVKT